MKKELEQKLAERFPTFFRDLGGDPMNTCMAWGCECGSGWYDILFQMCLDIEKELEDKAELKEAFRFDQIKEKWGTLRVYSSGNNEIIYKIIALAEHNSGTVCENCGSTEDVKKEGPGWIITRCQKCKDEIARSRYWRELWRKK
jgi:ribosomal protein L37AE/L43A